MRSHALRIAFAIALLTCFIVGCSGDSFDRVSVGGTVTCEGNASPNGSILATPASTDTEAPNVSTVLTDGKFSFAADQGPVPGSYIFEISIQDPSQAPDPGEAPEGEIETGPATVYSKTVEIPEGGSDSLAIELTSADLGSGEGGGGDIPASGEM
jgi:hypothetical protein